MEDSYATMPGISSGTYGPSFTTTQPVGYLAAGMSSPTMVGGVTGVPAVAGGSLPPGARYQGSVTNPETGAIIDRYIVPQRAAVPVRSIVPEVQQFNVMKQVMVPETHEIQVPVQRMVPEQHTVMVPRTRMVPVQEMVPQTVTRMVPQTFTTTQQVQTTKPVTVSQPMQRTIQKVVEGQKIVEASRVIEYERPRLIPGRFLGTAQTQAREVGLQWTKSYYSGATPPQPAGSQSVMYTQQPAMYTAAVPSYTTPSYGYASSYAQEADFEGGQYQQYSNEGMYSNGRAASTGVDAAGTVI